MGASDRQLHLAWFLGPKAENADVMESLLLQALRDYFHWRKNYFPGDPILITRSAQREFATEHDALRERLDELLAALRRNFPFYSPRYMGHMLSDTTMASTLGFMTGLMFNPNNVTPESAPVTTELEIEATSAVLAMLGYEPPPEPPPPREDVRRYYERAGRKEYGWAHITSGGTTANIEALWIARQVRYFPLAVQEAARQHGLEITVQFPDGLRTDIRQADPFRLLLIKPREAIFLLPRYIQALRKQKTGEYGDPLWRKAWAYLNETRYAPAGGVGRWFADFPPAILVAGSRHYSIAKAADVIGVGQANLVRLKTDAAFRMDVEDLRRGLLEVIGQRRVPLCVVATAGTTEVGAVDPVHRIARLRAELEQQRGVSFWLHLDAAWGGFMRALFSIEAKDRVVALALKIGRQLDVPYEGDLRGWHRRFSTRVGELLDRAAQRTSPAPDHNGASPTRFRRNTERELTRMGELLEAGNYTGYLQALERFPERFEHHPTEPPIENFRLNPTDLSHWVREFVREEVSLRADGVGRRFAINWPSPEVGNAFVAFPEADSITVDPHKMGYVPYPCGCVAFRNDRVRLFVLQRAPYVTSSTVDPLLHTPPRHRQIEGADGRVVIDSFSPFILEGSKPGAAAAALWLAVKSIPLTARGHGRIVKQSLLAARELFEWLNRWDALTGGRRPVRFVTLTAEQPDTNIVCFVAKPREHASLAAMNRLTAAVYEDFTILSELGEREYSYGQAFFLSHTRIQEPEYSAEGLRAFFARCGLDAAAEQDYRREGLVVLRACVMNPYLHAAREAPGGDYARGLVEELDRSAQRQAAAVVGSRGA
ncbi:MAG: pyridoxal-dependent decarboxylase [Bryobacterales bacterium]|nr:pyridoxal-dependent decarboxylase [Bryobacterales bacterium]